MASKRKRDARGRFLSARQIAALAGWETRRRQAKDAAAARARRAEAMRHGQAARERSERRLTPEQRRARKRDAARIERAARTRPTARPRPPAPKPTPKTKPTHARAKRPKKKPRAQRETRRPKGQRLDGATRGRPSRTATSRRRPTRTPPRTTTEPQRSTPSTRSKRSTSRPTSTRIGKTSKQKRVRTSRATKQPRSTLTLGGRGGSGDSLKVQIGARLRLPAGHTPTNRLLYEAIAHRIDSGEDHPLVSTKIIRWQNPGRKKGELRQWRQGNQEDAWETLGPAIRAAIAREIGV